MTAPSNDEAAEALKELATVRADVEPELMLVTGSSAVRQILATRPTQELVSVLREIVLDYVQYWGSAKRSSTRRLHNPAMGKSCGRRSTTYLSSPVPQKTSTPPIYHSSS